MMKTTGMNTWMNKLNVLVLAVTLLFAQIAFGQTRAAEYQKQVGNLVFSLDNLQNEAVLRELDRMDARAGGALTVEIAAELAEVLHTSIELLKVIISDPSVSAEQKKFTVKELGARIGVVFSTVIRQHGDDALDPEVIKGRTQNEKLFYQSLGYAKKTLWESTRTVTDFVTFPRSTTPEGKLEGERVAKLLDRMFRDYIGQDATIELQKVITEVRTSAKPGENVDLEAWLFDLFVPAEDKQSIDGKPKEHDLGRAEKALRVRTNRQAAHYTVMGLLTFGGVLWQLTGFDFVGLMTDGTTMGSIKVSETIFYSTLASVMLMRQAVQSFAIVPRLQKLIEIIKNPAGAPEFSRLRLPLMSKLMRIESRVNKARAKLLTADGKPVPETRASLMERIKLIVPNIQEKIRSFRGNGGGNMCVQMVSGA